jgi:HlyD family secretion protein
VIKPTLLPTALRRPPGLTHINDSPSKFNGYVIPASVSFVAADAQFTPKTVETQEEREKLMFRVKLQLDAEVLKEYSRRVKTGIRGLGVVRTIAATAWPEDLQVKLP